MKWRLICGTAILITQSDSGWWVGLILILSSLFGTKTKRVKEPDTNYPPMSGDS